jgi:NAD(P)-dependent dehydrogenase (short-subunit alcohol dehydrogenase family)
VVITPTAPTTSLFAAAKAGCKGLVEAGALELMENGREVCGACPRPVEAVQSERAQELQRIAARAKRVFSPLLESMCKFLTGVAYKLPPIYIIYEYLGGSL